jgi:hypothetical protein
VAESGEVLDNGAEPEEAFAAGVRFVATHHGGPLFGGHGAGAGIAEQIDEDIGRAELEQIVASLFQKLFALSGVVRCKGSTLLMRNGSMMVFIHCYRDTGLSL